MEADTSTPLFNAGQEIATFLVSCGILSKAWEESCLASNSEDFILNEYEGVAYVAFPSFHSIEDFVVKYSKYGEGNIQTGNNVFSGCLKGNDDQPALVHQGALKLFLHIMENTDFETKIYMFRKQRQLKPIIFVGHSLGGAVATLATLWVLEKRLRQSSPVCITFGCPLVGDERLVEAVGRENWGGNFCHVVSKHDIVPRILLAPFESTAKPLNALLPYWSSKMTNADNDQSSSSIRNDYRTLLQALRESDRSPYRPFGTYMFCSSHGAACIENSQTVLEMLHLTMQNQETSSDEIVQACLLEHVRYGSVVEDGIQKSISERKLANSKSESSYRMGIRKITKSKSESSYQMGILLQLEAIGVKNEHAELALRRAGGTENKYSTIVHQLNAELIQNQSSIVELQWYKEDCAKAGGSGYYDSFKNQNDRKYIDANKHRLKLAEFWDKIVEMWQSHELPCDFPSKNKWIYSGTIYSRLVEPLDIAYYYQTNNNGNYLSEGRYSRHRVIQKWTEEKEKNRSSSGQKSGTKLASLTQDSCFWAHVEEALKDLENLKQDQHQKLKSFEMFEDYVTRMIDARNICFDVFLEGSSFMIWWQKWKTYIELRSPSYLKDHRSYLYNIMEIESCRFIEEEISSKNDPALIALRRAKEIENMQTVMRLDVRDLSRSECLVEKLQYYKVQCENRGKVYCDDTYKINIYFKAEMRREKLARFWDEIIEMWERHGLPSDFQSQNKWINAGTTYRRLVEPLDIAHYYRRSKGKGNYLSDGRPTRHKVLQKWLEERKNNCSSRDKNSRKTLPFLTRDSCFWAHVKEALKDLEQGLHQKKDSLEKFEKYVTRMINDRNVSSDVFSKGSSFMKWWRGYKQIQSSEWKVCSTLHNIMESASWK